MVYLIIVWLLNIYEVTLPVRLDDKDRGNMAAGEGYVGEELVVGGISS